MLNVTAAQLDAWLAALMFPLARLLGLFASAPVLSNRMLSARVRLAIGLASAMAILPALPPMPQIPLDSWLALGVLVHQALIGIAIGFLMRLFFAAVDVAGEMIGLQMGLSFAIFFNPQTGGQSSVVAEFLGLLTLLIFLALNGHLMLIQVLVASFEWLPVGEATDRQGWLLIVRYASVMFSTGVLLALPMVAALLITNIALGVLTRAAPQLNLFAVGFPITLSVGM
ncbi:MAG: flagellar biosynthetic protein FliR, partial [Rhodocyclaceae bacterium]|nr:flagellar biosynthetic protein FliR [Rhodocyclaceae bacterium]